MSGLWNGVEWGIIESSVSRQVWVEERSLEEGIWPGGRPSERCPVVV